MEYNCSEERELSCPISSNSLLITHRYERIHTRTCARMHACTHARTQTLWKRISLSLIQIMTTKDMCTTLIYEFHWKCAKRLFWVIKGFMLWRRELSSCMGMELCNFGVGGLKQDDRFLDGTATLSRTKGWTVGSWKRKFDFFFLGFAVLAYLNVKKKKALQSQQWTENNGRKHAWNKTQ